MTATYNATEFLRARATRAAEAYAGRNMSLRAGGRVHSVGTIEWIDGLEAPAPSCHTSGAAGPMVGAIPTDRAVNCRKCLGRRPIKRPPRRASRRARVGARADARRQPPPPPLLPLFEVD